MDSLRNLAALAAAGGPHPLKYLQGACGEYLRALALGSGFLRPGGCLAAATRRRRALSRRLVCDRADLTRGSDPCPSLRLSRTPWHTCP